MWPISFPALDDAAAAAAASAAAAAVNLPSPLRNPLAFRIVSIALVLKQSFPATDGAAIRSHLFDLVTVLEWCHEWDAIICIVTITEAAQWWQREGWGSLSSTRTSKMAEWVTLERPAAAASAHFPPPCPISSPGIPFSAFVRLLPPRIPPDGTRMPTLASSASPPRSPSP